MFEVWPESGCLDRRQPQGIKTKDVRRGECLGVVG